MQLRKWPASQVPDHGYEEIRWGSAHHAGEVGDAFGEAAGSMGYRKFKPGLKRRVVEEWVSGGKRIAEVCQRLQADLRSDAYGRPNSARLGTQRA
jgi:hypothetical protein